MKNDPAYARYRRFLAVDRMIRGEHVESATRWVMLWWRAESVLKTRSRPEPE